MTTVRALFVISIVTLLSACAPSRLYINLEPRLPTATPSTQPLPVVITVEDARSAPAFGKRGDADLLTNQNVPTVLRSALVAHLQQRGYSVRDSADADTVGITVTIRALELNAQMTSWNVKVDLSARIAKGTADYKGNYGVEKDGKVVLTPSLKDSEKWLNDSLNETLSKMFSDGNFMKFLAQ